MGDLRGLALAVPVPLSIHIHNWGREFDGGKPLSICSSTKSVITGQSLRAADLSGPSGMSVVVLAWTKFGTGWALLNERKKSRPTFITELCELSVALNSSFCTSEGNYFVVILAVDEWGCQKQYFWKSLLAKVTRQFVR